MAWGELVTDAILRHYWHPVATSNELGKGPLGVCLLDERVVLWRAEERVAAFRDLCVHRGTALSLGWIQDDNLVCGYHGWTYDPDGACVRIPSLVTGRAIPAKARATAVFMAQERYGLVWVCLAEPRAAIPLLPELEDPDYHTFFHSAEVWETSAARMIENFIDTSHFPYVHPDINATRDDPVIPDFQVERSALELYFETKFTAPSGAAFQGPNALASYSAFTEGRRQYRVVLPFAAQAVRPMAEGRRQLISIIASPISAKRMRYYTFSSRNFALDRPDNDFRQLIQTIFAQDRVIVESQRPEELPLDLSAELHLKGPDAGTLQYRRMLAELGLK
jgi:phenylpropionate dioxygenase-like ring-hydroxylating dioxygenase large terminal subunit